MKILDAGHKYLLDSLDGGTPQLLTFVKREGENFPFNVGAYSGTNAQEVIRALIDRTKFLLSQKPCAETQCAFHSLESALLFYELRAARRHGRQLDLYDVQQLVHETPCPKCGHIRCGGHDESVSTARS